MKIRRAKIEDADEIWLLEIACFKLKCEQFDIPYIQKLIKQDNAIVSVLISDTGDIIGWVIGVVRETKNVWHIKSGRIYDVGVYPSYQSKGLGKRLTEYICRQMKNAGAQRITLEVESTNENAIGLYISLGFKKKRIYRNYYGKGLDGYWMVKE